MPAPSDAQAVLVTGVYGSGKSTVVADLGGMLEERREHYGALDIDWLGWFYAGGDVAVERQLSTVHVERAYDRHDGTSFSSRNNL